MALMWIAIIILYFIFNINMVLILLATEEDCPDKQTRMIFILIGIFFGLPFLLIFGIVALVVASVQMVRKDLRYDRLYRKIKPHRPGKYERRQMNEL